MLRGLIILAAVAYALQCYLENRVVEPTPSWTIVVLTVIALYWISRRHESKIAGSVRDTGISSEDAIPSAKQRARANRQGTLWHVFIDDVAVASFDEEFFNDQGPVEIGGKSYSFTLHSPGAHGYLLEELKHPDGIPTKQFQATKYKFVTFFGYYAWSISLEERWLDLRGGSWWSVGGNFSLYRFGNEVGRVTSKSAFGDDYLLQFLDPLPTEIVVLILLLCITRRYQSRRGLFQMPSKPVVRVQPGA